jgi:uncharacterized protein
VNPYQILSEDELDELAEFLLSDTVPENGMDISTLDGFLAAVLLTPELVLPSQWLPWVWDIEDADDTPAFEDAAQAERVMGLIMRHYNMVARSIDEDWYEPLLYRLDQPDDGELFDAELWAAGFMVGMSILLDPWWRPLFDEESDLLAPMVLLGTEAGRRALDESGDHRAVTLEALEAISDAVAGLHEYFRPMREELDRERRVPIRRAAPKVGRNDPCPCGSGKKFKKCCGAEEPQVDH